MLLGHEDHAYELHSWLQWIGSFHFVFLHFPIALIVMTGISELLFAWTLKPMYNYAVRFMLISAAVLALPTALLGLIYSYTETYTGYFAEMILWHMWGGITTALFALFVLYLREKKGLTNKYYSCLILLILLVTFTALLGGKMSFKKVFTTEFTESTEDKESNFWH